MITSADKRPPFKQKQHKKMTGDKFPKLSWTLFLKIPIVYKNNINQKTDVNKKVTLDFGFEDPKISYFPE